MFDIKDTRAYRYAVKCVNDDSGKTGRYVKKQCAQWLEIADGKDPDCYISEKAYKKVTGILKLMGVDPNAKGNRITEDELKTLVDVGLEEGAIENDEFEIFEIYDTDFNLAS